jgi:hypothetical protein
MESQPVSRAALIDVYISGLNLVEVAIVGAGRQCRIHTDGKIAPGEPVAHRYHFKASHAELVLATIGHEGCTDQLAAAPLAALVERTAATLGASYVTPAELRKAAEAHVNEITERIRVANQSGGMKEINKQYKRYRQEQIAKGEGAVPYSKYVEPFITRMVRNVAATGRMI